jgi:hypothetical protein
VVAPRRSGEPLYFRGTPGDLSAALRGTDETPRRLPVEVELASTRGGRHVTRATRLPDDMLVQMTLPPRTPPGRYRGTVEIAGEKREVVIEVEPEVELRLVPDQLSIHASPGDEAPAALTIANAGNVSVELRRAYAFGVFAAGGLERALHHAYTDDRPEGETRIDYLAERLAEEHGGLVRVRVEEGAGRLEPGHTREVLLRFQVPPRLRPGRTYTGTLPFCDIRYYVRLVLSKGQQPPGLKSS